MIRVLIVDDQRLMRDGLRTLIGLEPDLEVVGAAADGEEALEIARQTEVDVVLLDIRMPRLDGIAAVRRFRAEYPSVKVLMLTTYDDRDDIVNALSLGAVGYLLKDMPAEEIAAAIRTAHAGGAVLPPRIAREFLSAVQSGQLVGNEAEPGASTTYAAAQTATEPAGRSVPEDRDTASDDHSNEASLTDRERDVLHCLARGMSNREIAAHLHVTEGTVKNHVSSLISKLNLRDRTQVALYAVRRGYGGHPLSGDL